MVEIIKGWDIASKYSGFFSAKKRNSYPNEIEIY